MLISYRHQFLFVHIAKTGGTSVRAALQGLRWRDPVYYLQFVCSRMSHLTGHRLVGKLPRHAKVIAAKEMLPHEMFERLFKFAFVRNPWDLQVSSFHHIRRERPHLMQGMEDFKQFMAWKLSPERLYQYHIDTSMLPQVDYLRDLSGTMLMDFVGRYERLQQDFDHVCEQIGLSSRSLPHKRRARQRHDYRSYYDDELAERVGMHFKADIEAFDYRFE